MKKARYIIVIIVFLFLSLILFRNFFLYQPILDHLGNRLEKKWGCKVAKRKADLNLLKGSLTLKDAHIMTPEGAISRWDLKAEEIFIRFDYPSLISGNTIVNELILDKVIFRQGKGGGLDTKKKDISPKIIRKRIEHLEKKKVKPSGSRKGTLVRYFLVRDGYFEFYCLNSSGKESRLKMEHVNLSGKEIFLGRELAVFFRSLLESLEP